MTFYFELPTTGNYSFAQCLVASTPTQEITRFLAQAGLARNSLRSGLKECRRAGAAKDWASVARSVDNYLPYAFTIKGMLDSDELLVKQECDFSWRPILSESKLAKSKRLGSSAIEYEVAFCLLTYGLCQMNLASRAVANLGDYEKQRATSEIERQRLDEQLNNAADLLCRASGLFSYLSDDFLVKWEDGTNNHQRPLDLSRETTSALSNLALADAERLAIRKLLSKSHADALIAPGPPLSRSHPSPALLAKLQLNVHSLYENARSSYKSSANFNQGTKRDPLTELRTYLSNGRTINAALSYKWLGVEAGESSGNRIGDALGWLKLAENELASLSPKTPSFAVGKKNKDTKKERKSRLDVEIESIQAFTKVYKTLNDTVAFQSVPDSTSLLSKVPTGRAALIRKPYSPPKPILPMNISDLSLDQLDRMQITNDSDSEDSSAPSSKQTGTAEYALQGQYY